MGFTLMVYYWQAAKCALCGGKARVTQGAQNLTETLQHSWIVHSYGVRIVVELLSRSPTFLASHLQFSCIVPSFFCWWMPEIGLYDHYNEVYTVVTCIRA